MAPDKDEEERDDDDLDDEEGDHMAARSNLRHRDAGFNSSGGIDILICCSYICCLYVVYKEIYFEFDMTRPS